jgi:hypothetical protein
MPNHFHLLLRSVGGRLSDGMRHLGSCYSKRLNRLHSGWDGPVFRGRFRSKLIEDERYLRTAVTYIHLNPVRAGLVPRIRDSLWCSLPALVGDEDGPDFLRTDDIRELFGGPAALLIDAWEHHSGRRSWPEEARFRDEFLDWDTADPERAQAPSVGVRPTPEEMLSRVIDLTGASLLELRTTNKGCRGNLPRRLAMWALVTLAGLTLREAGQILNASPSAVSHAVQRMRERPPVDRHAADWMRIMQMGDI